MKRIFGILALVLLSQVTGTAFAAPVNVDFSVLGINSIDITTSSNPGGYTLNGVTFRYDDFASGMDFASVDAAGVFGTTGGSLIMDFSVPARQLSFDLSLLGNSAPVANALILTTYNSGVDLGTVVQDALANDINGDALVEFAYNGLAFDRAQMFFDFTGPFFSIANVSYDPEAAPSPVPEPASILLLAAGLLGVAGYHSRSRRRGVLPGSAD